MDLPQSPAELATRLDSVDYLADEGLATAAFLALRMGRPLFVEGEAGVGKTALAQALADALDAPLIRLQCYEGSDAPRRSTTGTPRQLLHLRRRGGGCRRRRANPCRSTDRRFLVARPLLQAVEASTAQRPAVLLVDEVDRADDEFEAFLLEVLGDFLTVSIPEIGTIHAEHPPVVVVMSNRTVRSTTRSATLSLPLARPPGLRARWRLSAAAFRRRPAAGVEVARAAQRPRRMDLVKLPGLAESIDWAAALATLGATGLDRDLAARTLGAAVNSDQERVLAAVGDGGFT